MVGKKDVVEGIILTVHCINGEKIVHRYKLPSTIEEVEELFDNITDMITSAIAGNTRVMFLENPSIEYNPQNIVGVKFGSITRGQIEILRREAQKGIGFKRG